MPTRCAIFEGTIRPDREEEFFRLVEERLLPLWRRMPHATAVRVVSGVETDEGTRRSRWSSPSTTPRATRSPRR